MWRYEFHPGEGGEDAARFAAELSKAFCLAIGGFHDRDGRVWAVATSCNVDIDGVHRVMRVPDNERNGRRHTSTVTVVKLSPREQAAVDLSGVREDVYIDSGPGGQHRNKTASAVRLTHPSGLIVTATESRSQHDNREMAWKRMRAALADAANAEHLAAVNEVRAAGFGVPRQWTWCSWRDEVVSADGVRHSMKRALRGDMTKLLKGAR